MDNQRLLTWGAFGLLLFFTYQTWMQDYGPKPEPAPQTQELEAPLDAAVDDLPGLEAPDPVALPATDGELAPTAEVTADDTIIRVVTDVMDVSISTRGGSIVEATMLQYPVAKDRPDELVRLLSREAADYGSIRSWLRSAGDNVPAPGFDSQFEAAQTSFELGSADTLVVPLRWEDASGVSVEKRFTFTRGSYAIRLEHEVTNASDELWRGDQVSQIRRRSKDPDRSMFDVDSYSFDGPQIYDGDSAEKLDRGDLRKKGPLRYDTTDGWVAAIQHHFLTAIVPATTEQARYQLQLSADTMVASVISPSATAEPGASVVFSRDLFVGPKLQRQLKELHPRLKLAVDYGWLTLLSDPMFWLLDFLHGFVANWGVAIILVTIIIKLVFYKLTETSGRSMAKMRNLQPRMKALQERYKDDRQALSQAMMDLYKREGVNPAAGCLPILVQMPFFLAFYWVLVESVEMRQAPFVFWLTDLSTRDPYFILPLIMGAAMLLQQKLNPAPTDPVQARVMQIMPIVFTGFFAFFPSGLVLYWVTNTLLSIAQQWKINKVVEAEAKAEKDRGSKKPKDKSPKDKSPKDKTPKAKNKK